MWVCLPGGMAMPALIPEEVWNSPKKSKALQEAFDNGWRLQIRGRLRSHLENFQSLMPEGTYTEIEDVKGTDYNGRFYCSHETWGLALSRAALEIDYVKFKSTSERKNPDGTFKYGKDAPKYHSVLIDIWGASCRLNSAYSGLDHPERGRGGDRVIYDLDDYKFVDRGLSPKWRDQFDPDQYPYGDNEILENLAEGMADIPYDQWEDYLSPSQQERLKRYLENNGNKRLRSKRTKRKGKRRELQF